MAETCKNIDFRLRFQLTIEGTKIEKHILELDKSISMQKKLNLLKCLYINCQEKIF